MDLTRADIPCIAKGKATDRSVPIKPPFCKSWVRFDFQDTFFFAKRRMGDLYRLRRAFLLGDSGRLPLSVLRINSHMSVIIDLSASHISCLAKAGLAFDKISNCFLFFAKRDISIVVFGYINFFLFIQNFKKIIYTILDIF